MITKVKSCGLSGLAGYIVEVEIDLAMGIPAFDIVGLPGRGGQGVTRAGACRGKKLRVRVPVASGDY